MLFILKERKHDMVCENGTKKMQHVMHIHQINNHVDWQFLHMLTL
jgi:hypothetical protein